MTRLDDFRAGALAILPAGIAAAPFGVLLGALAAAKGLSPVEVALMSSLVFAGGSQFAALEMWTLPAPLLFIAFSTLLINSRHILMGASIAPRMARFRPWHRLLALFVLADEV
jgi:branched chain amino acid efflux pump